MFRIKGKWYDVVKKSVTTVSAMATVNVSSYCLELHFNNCSLHIIIPIQEGNPKFISMRTRLKVSAQHISCVGISILRNYFYENI